MADYTNVAAVKTDMPDSELFSSTAYDYDGVIQGMITGASRLIDKEVGGWPNYFYPSTADETRYFDGSGEVDQFVDPLISITSVAVSESGGRASTSYTAWTENTDYFVWPYNYASIGQPIQILLVDNDSGGKGTWGSTRKGVKVTGVFGYSSYPPADIQQACKITAMRWFMRAKQSWQDTSVNAAMGELLYTQSLDPDVKEILKPYKTFNAVMG
jgi:hypothetical protein